MHHRKGNRPHPQFHPWMLMPKAGFIPLIFMFCVGMQGAGTIHEAVTRHYFFSPETWWIPLLGLVLFNCVLGLYLKPALHLAISFHETAETKARLARAALKRLKFLVWFTIALSIALLFGVDALVALRTGAMQQIGFFAGLKIMVNIGSGFFLGVLMHFLVDNGLFPVKRLIRQYAPGLPLPFQTLYFKILLVVLASTALLLIQAIAIIPSFIMLNRPDDAPALHQRSEGGQRGDLLMLLRNNSDILFNPGNYGAKDAFEVFFLQVAVYLAFILLMLTQVKFLIKKPLATIGGRLHDLNGGSPENLCSIDVVQNDEFASVFTEINRLIDTQKTALNASQERLSHIVAGAADPIVVFDSKGAIKLFNPAAEAFFGYAAAEVAGIPFSHLVDLPADVACACETTALPLIHYLLQESASLSRYEGLHKNGTRKPFESNISTTDTPEGPLFTAILRDIANQLAVEEALTKAKLAAENANRMKSEFLANMSHELRTPLNAVLGFTQLLSNDKNLTEGQLNKISIISRSGEHLLALINDILDISKIEAGKFDMHSAVFDLEAFVGDLRDMFQLRCQKKGLNLDVEVLEGLPRYVRGDLGKLRQVLINLVGNAVKFTSEGGIGVVVGPDGGRIRFSVNDSGKGIPEAELELIMQPFTQSTNTDNEGGTGLGLAISNRFIELMGGRLEVASQLGEGSTFSFAIPLEATDETPAGPEQELKAVAVKEGRSVLALIVDDKTTNRLILKEMLEGVGFSTIEAENGQEAVERTAEFRPRIVFMDIKMPVLDGHGAVRRIKADPALAAIPVFALTASAFKHDEEQIRASGFDGYLAKPFKQSSLFRLIHDHTDIELEYETPAAPDHADNPVQPEAASAILGRIGQAGLDKLDDMALINDFTAIRNYADTLKGDLPGFAAVLVRLAGAFDETALTDLINGLRSKGWSE